ARPPALLWASSTMKRTLADASRLAAPRPAAPAPMTTTSKSSVLLQGMKVPSGLVRHASFRHGPKARAQQGSIAAAANWFLQPDCRSAQGLRSARGALEARHGHQTPSVFSRRAR